MIPSIVRQFCNVIIVHSEWSISIFSYGNNIYPTRIVFRACGCNFYANKTEISEEICLDKICKFIDITTHII